MLVWIWLSCLVAAVYLYLRQFYCFFKRRGVKTSRIIPPFGTIPLSVLLQREHFAEQISRVYNHFSDQRFYGGFQLMKPLFEVRDIELIKKVLVKDFEHFIDHNTIIQVECEPLFGRILMSLKGQEWKDMRSTLSPAFTSSKIKMMLPLMVEVGNQMIPALNKKIKESKHDYLDIDVKDLTTRYTNDVIASCAFGLKVDSQTDKDNEFYEMGKTVTNFNFLRALKMFMLISFPKAARTFKWTMFPESVQNFFRTLVKDTMQNRELKNIVRPDMIHLLMEAKKGKLTHDVKPSNDADAGFATVEESSMGQKKVNRVWSDDDLIAQAFLFFVAGFEPVSAAVSFMLLELAINPDFQERLYQEIRENEAKNNGQFDYYSIQNMVYLDMVVSETLRLWPPAIVMDRCCNKNYNLGKPNDQATEDVIMRKGDTLQIPVHAIHHDPEYYPNPQTFDPERFSEENKHKIQPFTYMPFGVGPRNCIGSRFALCEVKVMAYQVLNYFEVSPSEKTIIPPKYDPSTFNVRAKGGHWLRFKTRRGERCK